MSASVKGHRPDKDGGRADADPCDSSRKGFGIIATTSTSGAINSQLIAMLRTEIESAVQVSLELIPTRGVMKLLFRP